MKIRLALEAAAATLVVACAFLAAAGNGDVEITPKARRSIDSGLRYLAKTQLEDGSWKTAAFGAPTAVASLAGLAFMSDGHLPGRGKYAGNVARALDYVLKSAQPTGLLEYGTPHHAMYSHAFSTLFLAEAWGMTARPDIRDKLKNAVDLIIRTQNREGGWRYEPKVADADISVTVSQIVALRAAANAGIAVPRETVDNAIGYLRKCVRPDGGFSYQAASGESAFPRSGGALACFALTGLSGAPEVSRDVNYLLKTRDYAGRFFYYGQYYSAQGIHLAAPDKWPEWYRFIAGLLGGKQAAAGSWNAPGEEAVQSTAMSVLILTIPNGYLPLYQR